MTISMYQLSVPRFVSTLTNLSNILDKAQAHVDARKLDPAALTTYRLFPDMLPLSKQVQIACDTAKGAVARLAGVEIPVHEDNEKTLAELQARIAKRRACIQSVTGCRSPAIRPRARWHAWPASRSRCMRTMRKRWPSCRRALLKR